MHNGFMAYLCFIAMYMSPNCILPVNVLSKNKKGFIDKKLIYLEQSISGSSLEYILGLSRPRGVHIFIGRPALHGLYGLVPCSPGNSLHNGESFCIEYKFNGTVLQIWALFLINHDFLRCH